MPGDKQRNPDASPNTSTNNWTARPNIIQMPIGSSNVFSDILMRGNNICSSPRIAIAGLHALRGKNVFEQKMLRKKNQYHYSMQICPLDLWIASSSYVLLLKWLVLDH